MKTYQYILLDWDGNLAKTLDIWLEAARHALQKRGLNLSDEDIAASFGAFTVRWKEWGVDDVETALEEAGELAKQNLPNVELYPDALEVLEQLHAKNKQLALITSSPLENVKHLLEKYNLSRFFSATVTADDVTHFKPDPEPLETALEMLRANKDDAIMIGDSDKDILAAHNTGIDSILFYPTEHKKYYNLDELKKHSPTHIVSDFRDVLDIV